MNSHNVVIVGNPQSGKTTFTAKLSCDSEASNAELTSHGCNYYAANWLIDGRRQQVNCFDISGAAKKDQQSSALFISTAIDVVIIILDLSLSIEDCKNSAAKWLKFCDQYLMPRDQVFFFGTKSDVVSAQSVSTQSELATNLGAFGFSEDQLILGTIVHSAQSGNFNRIKNLIVNKLSNLQSRKKNLGLQKTIFTSEEASIGLVKANLASVMRQRSRNYQRQVLVIEYASDNSQSQLSTSINQYPALPSQDKLLEMFHQDEFEQGDKWHSVHWWKTYASTINQISGEEDLINLMQKMDVIIWSLPISDRHIENQELAQQMRARIMNAYAFIDEHSIARNRLLFVRMLSSNDQFAINGPECLQSIPFFDFVLSNTNAQQELIAQQKLITTDKVSKFIHDKLCTINPLLQEHHIWENPLTLVLPVTKDQSVAIDVKGEKADEKASEAPVANALSTSNTSLDCNCLVLDDDCNQDCVDMDEFKAFKTAQDQFLQSEVKDQNKQKALNIPLGTKFKFRKSPDNQTQTLVYILPKTAGKNKDGYNGFYAEEKIFKQLPEDKRHSLEEYKALDKGKERAVYFLKMFPTEENEIGEGLCEALTGAILDRLISVGIIPKKYQRVFAPPRMIYVQGRAYMALWQPAILGARAFYNLSHPEQKKKNPLKEMINRMTGFGYELDIPDGTKFSGLSYYFMIMLIFGNHSWHSDNVMYTKGTKAIRVTGVDYGATFRNLLATEEQSHNIWKSLEELSGTLNILRNLYEAEVWKNPGNVKPEMLNIWVHKKYAEFYRNIPGLFDSIANHAKMLCDRIDYLESNSTQFLSLIEQAIVDFVDDAQKFGVDGRYINELCKTIYVEKYDQLSAQVNQQPVSEQQHYQTQCMAKDVAALALRRLYTIGSDAALAIAPKESYVHLFTRTLFPGRPFYHYSSIAPTDASSVTTIHRDSIASQGYIGLELTEPNARLSDARHSNLRLESSIYKIESLQLVTRAVITEVAQLSKDKRPIISLLLSDASDSGISSAFINLCYFTGMDKADLANALEVFPAYADEFVVTHLLKLLVTLRNYQLAQNELTIFYHYIPALNKSALRETEKLATELHYQTLSDCVDADMQPMITQAMASGVSDSVLLACLNGDSATLAVLLCDQEYTSSLVDSNNSAYMDISPYVIAIANGHVSCLKLLLLHQNTINLRVRESINLLTVAQLFSQQAVIVFLSEKRLKFKTESMETLWLGAASQGNLYLLQKLLQKRRVNINHQDKSKKTAIQLAAEHNHPDCVLALIQAKAGLDVTIEMDDKQFSLLMWAARHNHLDCVSALIQEQVALNTQDQNGNTAVMFAAAYGHTKCVELLIDKRADLTVRNRGGNTALMLAINPGNRYNDCLAAFYAVQAETLQDESGCTDFMWLARQGDLSGLGKLIQVNATLLNVADKFGNTALFYAARCGHGECILLLLDQGAEINVRNHDGDTALSLAAKNGHAVCVKLLVDRGADLMVRNRAGNTPLMLSITNNHKICMSILFSVGAETLRDEAGYTDLMWSAKHGNLESLRGLIEGGLQESIKFGFILDGPISGARGGRYHLNRYSHLLNELSKSRPYIKNILEAHLGFGDISDVLNHKDNNVFIDALCHVAKETFLMEILCGFTEPYCMLKNNLKNSVNNDLLVEVLPRVKAYAKIHRIVTSQRQLKIDGTYRATGRKPFYFGFSADSAPVDEQWITKEWAVHCLLELGRAKFNLDQLDHTGNTALMLAASGGHNDCLYVLNEYGADLQVKNQKGNTALKNCAFCGSDDGIMTLLQGGAAKNETREHLTNVLQIAASRDCSVSLAGLIEAGADFTAESLCFGSVLGDAAISMNLKGIRSLIDAGASIGYEFGAREFFTPIMVAILINNHIERRFECLREMLDPKLPKHYQRSGYSANSWYLARQQALGLRDDMGRTALHYAIENVKPEYWSIKCLQIMLQFEKNNSRYSYIDIQDQDGNTPLMSAAGIAKSRCVDLLIQAGADVHLKNGKGQTALDVANSRRGSVWDPDKLNTCRRLLIKARNKFDAGLISFEPMLTWAFDNEYTDFTAIWINDKALVNEVVNGITPLTSAVCSGRIDIAKQLIRAGANLDVQDKYYGKTALMHVVACGDISLTKLFIRKGANLSLRDHKGRTALDHARFCGNSNCVTVLTRAAANASNTSANIGFFWGNSHRDQDTRTERSSQWGYKGVIPK